MNNTQSIIVYRNPAEAAFWEGGGIAFVGVFILACAVCIPVCMIAEKYIVRPLLKKWEDSKPKSGKVRNWSDFNRFNFQQSYNHSDKAAIVGIIVAVIVTVFFQI